MRAYFTNDGAAKTGGVRAVFFCPPGAVATTGASSGFRVRRWDGTVVDARTYRGAQPHPATQGGGEHTVVAEWNDTLPANADLLAVDLVAAASSPQPPVGLDPAWLRVIQEAAIRLRWRDIDPLFPVTSQSERDFDVEPFGRARLLARPLIDRWSVTTRGMTTILRARTSVGRGRYRWWDGTELQGRLVVTFVLEVIGSARVGNLWMEVANTAPFPWGSAPPNGFAQTAESDLGLSLADPTGSTGGIRVTFVPPTGLGFAVRPMGVVNYSTGQGPCPIRSVNPAAGLEWDLAIRGLSRCRRYPFLFSIAIGTGDVVTAATDNANTWLGRVAAGGHAELALANGFWVPPVTETAQTLALHAQWHSERRTRWTQFLEERLPEGNASLWVGFAPSPAYGGAREERASDPWNLLGNHPDTWGGGVQKQIGFFQEGRAIYGRSPAESQMLVISSMRFMAMEGGLVEDAPANTPSPASIPHALPGYSYQHTNGQTYAHLHARLPSEVSRVQCGNQPGDQRNGPRPWYPANQTVTQANPGNPDTREQFANENGYAQRWTGMGIEHLGWRHGTIAAWRTQDPFMDDCVQRCGEITRFMFPDGYYDTRTLRDSSSGGGTRGTFRRWWALAQSWQRTGDIRFLHRIQETLWRMENDGSGNTWREPGQVSLMGHPDPSALTLNGVRPPGAGNPAVDYRPCVENLWQSSQMLTFLAWLIPRLAGRAGSTPDYPGVADMQEQAHAIAVATFNKMTMKLVRDGFGIPARRLGLTPRLLDDSIDWSTQWNQGYLWHRLQGYGTEGVNATPGSQPVALNRYLGGQTVSFTVGFSASEEDNHWPALQACRLNPAIQGDADLRARLDYLISLFAANRPHLVDGREDASSAGYSCGTWPGITTPRPETIAIDPPRNTTVVNQATSFLITGEARAAGVIRVWTDWQEGSTASNDVTLPVPGGLYSVTLSYPPRAEARTYNVRAVLNAVEARAEVVVQPARPRASFSVSATSILLGQVLRVTDTTTGVIDRRRWALVDPDGELTILTQTTREIELRPAKVGVWGVALEVTNISGTSTLNAPAAFTVREPRRPVLRATVTTSGTVAPVTVDVEVQEVSGSIDGAKGWLSWGVTPVEVEIILTGTTTSRVYNSGGTFQVHLWVVGEDGSSAAITVPVTVGIPPVQQDAIVDLPTAEVRPTAPRMAGAVLVSGVDPGGLSVDAEGMLDTATVLVAAKPPDVAIDVYGELLEAEVAGSAGDLSAGGAGMHEGLLDTAVVMVGSPDGLGTLAGSVSCELAELECAVAVATAIAPSAQVDAIRELQAAVVRGLALDVRSHSGVSVEGILTEALVRPLAFDWRAGVGQAPAPEATLGAATVNAFAAALTPWTQGIGLIPWRELSATPTADYELEAQVAMIEGQNITNFVRGQTIGIGWDATAFDADTLRSSRAFWHIYRQVAAGQEYGAPLHTIEASIDPVAKRISLVTVRSDTATLGRAATYFHRLELETQGADRDVPVATGTLQTADQPPMSDDLR